MEKTAKEMRSELKDKIIKVLKLYGFRNLDIIFVSSCLNLMKPSLKKVIINIFIPIIL